MKNSLKEYKRKRDFSITEEPEGKIKISKNFRFVIQKHDATRLHYDFRIEHNGVLKSWAVPKGLPFKNEDKHLAMHVEDHPVDYFDFEGIIPEGNYGAGEVIVWDIGNYWVPHANDAKEVVELIEEGFKKGEIKLILNGRKVKGLFALVRFKKAGENAWLMIKDKDEYEGRDFLKDERSVKSGKTLKEIDKSNNVKLEFASPMMATLGETAFDDPEYLFEEKLDGYRIISVINDDEVTLFSRNGENMNRKFPEIVESLSRLNIRAVLDGEVVAYNKDGVMSFQEIQQREKETKLIYHLFDILNINGISTLELPLIERKKYLKKLIKENTRIKLSRYVVEKGKSLFKNTLGKSEGIIAKRLDSKYIVGERTSDWIKIKNQMREEFVIGGVTKPKGKRNGFGSLIVGYYKRNKLTYVGHIGTGFDEKMIKTLMNSFEKLKRSYSPFINYKGDKTVEFWMEPVLICEATFMGWTKDNMIRHASFVGIRTDKLPTQTNREDSVINNILTKPTKIFWPEKKYTKFDLAKYYLEISPIILSYLKDRPQNLNRHPDGIKGISFYQKDIEFEVPEFVEIVDIKRDDPKQQEDELDKAISYILCQNVETLIFMANLGCIEINPWLSRVEHLENPDLLVFDIDPNGVEFKTVVKMARTMYEFLAEVGIEPFIKTSGKRGIHLYTGLNNKYTYDETRAFAELVAKIFEQKYPQIISLERSPKDRKHKIYIDYLQNRRGQTTASVYSVRPSKDATVSMPVKFEELNSKLDPTNFDIKNTMKRVDKYGDLWRDIHKRTTDLSKALKKLKSISQQ